MRFHHTAVLGPLGKLRLKRVTDIKPAGIPWRIHRDSARGWPCPYCWTIMAGQQSTPTAPTWDHVIPTSRGGSNEAANVIPACQRCNRDKADRDPATWLGELRYRRCARVKPVTRFLEIVMDEWSDEDRTMMWGIVEKAERMAEQVAYLRAAEAGRNLRKMMPARGKDHGSVHTFTVLLSDADRAHNVLASLGIDPTHWSWRGNNEVGVIINSQLRTLTFQNDEQFRAQVLEAMGKQVIGKQNIGKENIGKQTINEEEAA